MNEDIKDMIDLKEQYDVEHENYLRALADIENMRKNFAKKQADMNAYKYEPLLNDMLDILDDIERGLINNDFKLNSGAGLIFAKLRMQLYKYGLTRFDIKPGTEFDPDEMEANGVVDAGIENTDKVIKCTLIGYKYNDKIIRYPKVIVGK